MRSTIWTRCAAVAIFAALVTAGRLSAQSTYNFITLDPVNAVSTSGGSVPVAINKNGVVAGFYADSQFMSHGFVIQPPYSTFTVIDEPEAVFGTQVLSINANGVITGSFVDDTFTGHGFVSSPPYTSYTTFDDPNAANSSLVTVCQVSEQFIDEVGTFPGNINDSGTVAGGYVDQNCVQHAFVSNPPYTSFTTIDAPNAGTGFNFDQGFLQGTSVSAAAGLNDSGMVTGTAIDSNGAFHGYIYSRGKITGFDVPGAGAAIQQGTNVSAINSGGVIVGEFVDSSFVGHGFQRNFSGKISKFDVSGAGDSAGQGTVPSSINFQSAIVGLYTDSNRVFHGFVRNPGLQTQTFNDPNAGGASGQGTEPYTNNQGGSIVGQYIDSGSLVHGFVAIPVPQ